MECTRNGNTMEIQIILLTWSTDAVLHAVDMLKLEICLVPSMSRSYNLPMTLLQKNNISPPVACLLKSFLSQYLCFLFFTEKRITCCYRGDVFRVLNLLLYYQNNPWITSSEVTFPNNRLRTEAFTVVRVNYSSKFILGLCFAHWQLLFLFFFYDGSIFLFFLIFSESFLVQQYKIRTTWKVLPNVQAGAIWYLVIHNILL
jgi:hypothetical protein